MRLAARHGAPAVKLECIVLVIINSGLGSGLALSLGLTLNPIIRIDPACRRWVMRQAKRHGAPVCVCGGCIGIKLRNKVRSSSVYYS